MQYKGYLSRSNLHYQYYFVPTFVKAYTNQRGQLEGSIKKVTVKPFSNSYRGNAPHGCKKSNKYIIDMVVSANMFLLHSRFIIH